MTGSWPTASPRPVTPSAILAATLDGLVRRLEGGADVDWEWRAELRAARDLAAGLDPYLSRCTTPESADLRRIAGRTDAEDWTGRGEAGRVLEQEMLSGHVEGQLLQTLVHATRARRVLDIGMFTGYSALAMAEALPADGRVTACEIDPEVARIAADCFRDSAAGGRVEVRVGPAEGALRELAAAGDRFDLVFLDADKAGYAGYLSLLLDLDLLAPHGLICVDNTLLQGQPWCPGRCTADGLAVAAFNDVVSADDRVRQVVVPLRDGITLIRLAQEG